MNPSGRFLVDVCKNQIVEFKSVQCKSRVQFMSLLSTPSDSNIRLLEKSLRVGQVGARRRISQHWRSVQMNCLRKHILFDPVTFHSYVAD